jgi:hypothetical protein
LAIAGARHDFAVALNSNFARIEADLFQQRQHGQLGRSLARFWIVALAGFGLNSLFVYLVTGTAGLGYGWAIPLIAGFTPLLTFVLAKRWAFQG